MDLLAFFEVEMLCFACVVVFLIMYLESSNLFFSISCVSCCILAG